MARAKTSDDGATNDSTITDSGLVAGDAAPAAPVTNVWSTDVTDEEQAAVIEAFNAGTPIPAGFGIRGGATGPVAVKLVPADAE